MFKKLFNEESIYNTIKPYYNIVRCYGYAPFTFVNNTKMYNGISIRIKLIDIILFMKTILCFLYFLIKFLSRSDMSRSRSTKIQHIGSVLIYTCEIVIVLFVLSLNLYNRFRILKFISLLHEFDEYIEYLGFSVNHQNQKRYVIIYSTLSLVSTTIMLTFNIIFCLRLNNCEYQWNLKRVISAFLIVHGFAICLSQLTMSLMAVKSRFVLLNKCFLHNFPTTNNEMHFPNGYCPHLKREHVVTHIAILHDLLNDAVDLVNICFTIPATAVMASGFLYNLLLIYDVLLIFLRVSKKHITILFIDFQWEIFVGAFIYAVISISSHTAREGNFTRLLVKKAEPFIGEDMLLQKKLRAFTQQLQHRTTTITCGLFSYNWNLLFTMIAATATYLVIFLQFDVSSHRIQDNNLNATLGFTGYTSNSLKLNRD